MKKIFSILAVGLFVTTPVFSATGFTTTKNINNTTVGSTTEFNKFDLSTWGETQKNYIVQTYLSRATTWYNNQTTSQHQTWGNWDIFGSTEFSQDNMTINTGFYHFNSYIKANKTRYQANLLFYYQKEPDYQTSLKTVLEEGIHFMG